MAAVQSTAPAAAVAVRSAAPAALAALPLPREDDAPAVTAASPAGRGSSTQPLYASYANIRRFTGTLMGVEFVLDSLEAAGLAVERGVHKEGTNQSHGRWEIRGPGFEVHPGYQGNQAPPAPLVDTIVQGTKGWKAAVLDGVADVLQAAHAHALPVALVGAPPQRAAARPAAAASAGPAAAPQSDAIDASPAVAAVLAEEEAAEAAATAAVPAATPFPSRSNKRKAAAGDGIETLSDGRRRCNACGCLLPAGDEGLATHVSGRRHRKKSRT